MSERRLILVAINVSLFIALFAAFQPTSEADIEALLPPTKLVVSTAGDETQIAMVTSRPLFHRPPQQPSVPPVEKPLPTAPAFRLVGVIWSETERLALVMMPSDAGHRRLRIGDVIDEWSLTELTPRSATFEAAGRQSVVSLAGPSAAAGKASDH